MASVKRALVLRSDAIPISVAAQLALLVVMIVTTFDVYRDRGMFAADWWTGAAVYLAVLSWLYFAAMVVRYVLTMALRPESRWFSAPFRSGFTWSWQSRYGRSPATTGRDLCATRRPYPIGVDADVVEASSPVIVVTDEV